jgi:hypothetical protein
MAGGVAALAMAAFGYFMRPWPMPTGIIPKRRYRRHRNQIVSVRTRA